MLAKIKAASRQLEETHKSSSNSIGELSQIHEAFEKQLQSLQAAEAGIESVFDLLEAEDATRASILAGLSERQVSDVAQACNRYPNIEVAFDPPSGTVTAGDTVTVNVGLEREQEGELGHVVAPRYPKAKEEAWWLVIGVPKAGQLSAIKRVTLARKAKVKLEFAAPAGAGKQDFALYLMCDSYMGCDQQFDFSLDIEAADEEDADMDAEDGAAPME